MAICRCGSLRLFFVIMAAGLLRVAAFSQVVPTPDQLAVPNQGQAVVHSDLEVPASPTMAASPSSRGATIPAGTRMLLVLQSPLNTTSGTAGSGIYLEIRYPVIQGDRVVIPAHTQVQGVVEDNRRPGHFQRASEFRFRFTTLIFPNNHAASIDGALQSIPGSRMVRAQKEGTINPVDQTEKVVIPAVAGAVGGAVVGSVSHFGIGTYVGAGLGSALAAGSALLQRGDNINLPRGTSIEIVLRSPLTLDEEQVKANAQFAPTRDAFPEITDSSQSGMNTDAATQRRRRTSRSRPLWEGLPLFR
jgi:hypothetical protein